MEPLLQPPVKKKRKIDYVALEKNLRYPLAWAFIVGTLLLNYFFFQKEQISLPTEATPVAIYSNQTGDDLHKIVEKSIEKAQKSITIMIFSFNDAPLLDLLKKKAEAGVKVLIVADAVASQDLSWKVAPPIEVALHRKKGLMHHKIIVIDGHSILYGSTNLTPESFIMHANLLIGVESEKLAQVFEQKALALKENKSCCDEPIAIESQKQSLSFYFSPDCHDSLPSLLELIRGAKKSIKVAIYTFTHQELYHALADAYDRGVDVEVVFDFEQAKQTSKKALLFLKRKGIKTALSSRNGLLHHKFAIIDDSILATGSANWTKAAFAFNDDLLSIISPLDEVQKNKIEAVWIKVKEESKPSYTSK